MHSRAIRKRASGRLSVDTIKRPLCRKDYLDWLKAHCPDLKVVH
jgi:hypothetical protein